MKSCRLTILPGFYIFFAFGILLIPLRWFIAWLVAAFVHELFHILALQIFGGHVKEIKIGMAGAIINADSLSCLRTSLCALAGPLGGFLLLACLRTAPRLALCGVIQSLYNLLPVYPLDGEKTLRGVVERFSTEKVAKKVITVTENVVLFLLVSSSLYGAFALQLGLYPLVAVMMLMIKNKKIPCKPCRSRVQ